MNTPCCSPRWTRGTAGRWCHHLEGLLPGLRDEPTREVEALDDATTIRWVSSILLPSPIFNLLLTRLPGRIYEWARRMGGNCRSRFLPAVTAADREIGLRASRIFRMPRPAWQK